MGSQLPHNKCHADVTFQATGRDTEPRPKQAAAQLVR